MRLVRNKMNLGVFMKLNKTALIATLATLSLSAISAQATIMEASSKGELAKVVYSCEGKKNTRCDFCEYQQR